MKYMLLLYWNDNEAPKYTTPEEFQTMAREWNAVTKEAQAAGVFISSNGLAPVSDATTIRVRDGKTIIADGPFAETHEVLGSYYLLECQDLDEAITWAQKIPAAKYGSIEIRPLNAYAQ